MSCDKSVPCGLNGFCQTSASGSWQGPCAIPSSVTYTDIGKIEQTSALFNNLEELDNILSCILGQTAEIEVHTGKIGGEFPDGDCCDAELAKQNSRNLRDSINELRRKAERINKNLSCSIQTLRTYL